VRGAGDFSGRVNEDCLVREHHFGYLCGIYFIDIQVYVAVTSSEFPVWLQDGKWAPGGKAFIIFNFPPGVFWTRSDDPEKPRHSASCAKLKP
jgi:hypothetical protein